MSRLRHMGRFLLHVEDTPNRVALAFGIGLFIAFLPLPIHTGLALVIALIFRLSRVALLAGAWVNNPWTLAPMYTAGTLLGCALLGVSPGGLADIDWSLNGRALWEGLRPFVLPIVVGNLVLGVLAGLLAYLVLRQILERRRPALQTGDLR